MIEFNSTTLDELVIESEDRALEISVCIVKCVIKALTANADDVVVGYMYHLDLDLTVESDGYLEALEDNLIRCEEAEEYELCQEAVFWIRELTIRNNVQ